MTIEEMKESIIKLAEHLLKVGDRLNNHLLSSNKTKMSPWGMVWFLMIGACYSLGRAEQFLNKSRKPQDQIDDAKKLLNQIIEKGVHSIDEESCGSWVIGYYLYSAEQRISSALDRLLKTCCGRKDRVTAFELIMDIVNQLAASKCKKGSYVVLRAFAEKEIKNAFEKDKLDKLPLVDKKGESWSQGKSLRKVWKRVNDIKHSPYEKTNPENPKIRWRDAYSALCGLLQIFEDFAGHKLKVPLSSHD